MQAYSNPKRAEDPYALPDVEVWEAPFARVCDGCGLLDTEGEQECDCRQPSWTDAPGWYWQSCFPGCLPDSEPVGPFATEAEALADAQEGNEEEEEDSESDDDSAS